jgi:ElaB/YqjD/DUF883 family membrane-anchored ribosome-binding protein
MASAQSYKALVDTVTAIKAIDQDRLLRSTIGEESLQQSGFAETLKTILQQASFAQEYAEKVDDGSVNNVNSVFNQIRQSLEAQAKRTNAEYVSQRQTFLTEIPRFREQLRQFWPPFVTAAVEARGFLQDEGIRQEYQRTVADMKSQAEDSLKHVREESEKVLSEAKKLAQEIEDRARKTAAHISVEAAQQQFREAQTVLKEDVRLWAWLSGIAAAAFILVAIYLAKIHLPEGMKWEIVYFAAIRITILTAVGAMATFCLRILRAHMHMSQQNLHRQRIANSMAAFVESAITPEQRDLILAQLVTSVADFGTSGLLSKEDDAVYSPKMTIEAITRTLSAPKS